MVSRKLGVMDRYQGGNDPMKTFPFFFAPEGDVSTLGSPGGIEVPVVPASIPSVTEVILGSNPAVENSPAVQAAEAGRTKGPQDFGMETPDESSERAGLKERARGADGKFVAKDPVAQPTTPAAKAPAKPVAKAPAPPAKPAVAKPVAPAPPAKVKIGNEEKTPEEWEAHFKALEEKASKPPETPAIAKAPTPDAPEKTEQELAAEAQQKEQDFLTRAAQGYLLPEAELDEIIAGGPQAPAKLATLLARAEMKGRQFAASAIDRAMEEFETRFGELEGVRDNYQRVQEVMKETSFLNANEDIKTHPEGLKTYREVSKQMHDAYASIQAKIEAGTASKTERGWALQYEDTKPEDLDKAIATYTREALAKLAPPAPPTTPAATPPAKPAVPEVPAEKPLSATRPGGAGTPRTETSEQRLAREVNAKYMP